MAIKTCFMIQPFDGAEYDRRFDAVIAPAIRQAGLEPYRTDRDPTTDIPVADIESEIRSSYACVADITLDNPNVWLEVGYALACHKRLCLICSKSREAAMPFDVRNRSVILYSPDDVDGLSDAVTDRLRAILDDDRLTVCQGNAEHLPFIYPGGELKEGPSPPDYEILDCEVREHNGYALINARVETSFGGQVSHGELHGVGPVHNGHAYLQYSISDPEHRQQWLGLALMKLSGFGSIDGYWLSESSVIPGTIASGRMTLKRKSVTDSNANNA